MKNVIEMSERENARDEFNLENFLKRFSSRMRSNFRNHCKTSKAISVLDVKRLMFQSALESIDNGILKGTFQSEIDDMKAIDEEDAE
jgi:hypothetical protein